MQPCFQGGFLFFPIPKMMEDTLGILRDISIDLKIPRHPYSRAPQNVELTCARLSLSPALTSIRKGQ